MKSGDQSSMAFPLLQKMLVHLPAYSCFSPARISSSFTMTGINQLSSSSSQGAWSDFIFGFLVRSCGLPPEKATEASNQLQGGLRFGAKHESVVRFLKQSGFSNAHIKMLTTLDPRFLRSYVENTLKPKLQELHKMGFCVPQIIRLISSNLDSPEISYLQSKIEFWMSLARDEEKLFKASERDRYLLSSAVAGRFMSDISMLHDRGISDDQIAKLFLSTSRFITANVGRINETVRRAKEEEVDELGVPRGSAGGSRVLWLALHSGRSEAMVRAKLRLLKNLGWTESEATSMIIRRPLILDLTDKSIRESADFLLKKVSCHPSYVANRPVLLGLNLQQTLIPRYHIMQILKLPLYIFYQSVTLPEDNFLKTFVRPNKVKIPGIEEAYFTACAGATAA